MGFFLDTETLSLSRPTQANLIEMHDGTFLEIVGPLQEVKVGHEQLVNEFSGIKVARDVESFAYKYGNLLGKLELEDIKGWLAAAKLVGKILNLQRVFIKRKSLLEVIGIDDTHFIWIDDNVKLAIPCNDIWLDIWSKGKRLKVELNPDDQLQESQLRMLTPLLIINEITPLIDVRIDFKEAEIISDLNWDAGDEYTFGQDWNENNTRCVPKERKYAPTLLSAIYHSLWRVVTDNREIQECHECHRSIVIRRQRDVVYCGAACKKRAQRKRKESTS